MEQTKPLEIAVVEDELPDIGEYRVLHEEGYKLDLFFTGDRCADPDSYREFSENLRGEADFYSKITSGSYDEIAEALSKTNYAIYLIDDLNGHFPEIIEKAQLPKEKVVMTSDLVKYRDEARKSGIATCQRCNLGHLDVVLNRFD